MISPARGNLVYLATKETPQASAGAGVSRDVVGENGGGTGDTLTGSLAGITDVSTVQTDYLKNWIPIILVIVAVYFLWKFL